MVFIDLAPNLLPCIRKPTPYLGKRKTPSRALAEDLQRKPIWRGCEDIQARMAEADGTEA